MDRFRIRPIYLLALAIPACFGVRSADSRPDQANELLAQARRAIGVEATQSNVRSLIVTGSFTSVGTARRALPPNLTNSKPGSTIKLEMAATDDIGGIRLSFLVPGSFRQDYAYSSPDGQHAWTRTLCRNGDVVWLENSVAPAVPAGTSVSVNPAPTADAAIRQNVRFAHARYLLAFLLYVDPAFPITLNYAGKAEAPDGRADVLDGEGPDGFAVRLFLDEKTHRPLMLTYTVQPSGTAYQLRLEEHRETDGIFFPHLLSRSSEGKLREQLRLEKFQLNVKIDPREFRK